jgi:hypothetical protein
MRELIGSLSASLIKDCRRWAKPELETCESDSAAVSYAKLIKQLGNMDFHGAFG